MESGKMDLKIDYNKKESERFSKLIISYFILVLGIIFLIGLSDFSSAPAYNDFLNPIITAIALSPLWYLIAVASQALLENFWPLFLIYYGGKWALKFEKKPGK